MVKYFWILPTSFTRYIWIPLALLIKERLQIEPLFIVISEQDKSFYLKMSGGALDDKNFSLEPNFYLTLTQNHYSDMDLFEIINSYEKKYKFTVYRDMIQADRHIGRNWAWAWNGKPESRAMKNTDRYGALRASLAALEYFEKLYQIHPPEFVIGSGIGTGLSGKPISLICRKNNIPFRATHSARFNKYTYWATDEFGNNLDICQKIRALEKEKKHTVSNRNTELRENQKFQSVYKTHTETSKSIISALKLSFVAFLRRYFAILRDIGKTKTGYYPLSLASMPIRQWAAGRLYRRSIFKDITKLPAATKYFLFPLQFDFESSLQGEAPQVPPIFTLIHQISLSLPAGAVLLVKEHPLQAGRRPKFVYDLIKDLHNVVLVKPTIKASMIFDKVDAVIQINSSMGYEALAQGVPIFSLSPHGIIHGSSLNESISAPFNKLKRFSLNETSFTSAERRHLALSFTQTIQKTCFELPNPPESFDTLLSKKDVEEMYEHLVKSLDRFRHTGS